VADNQTVDYRALLVKYLTLVQGEEGISYLEHETPRKIAPSVELTQQDIDTLHELAREAWYELCEDE